MEKFQYNIKDAKVFVPMEDKDIPKQDPNIVKLSAQYRKANNIPDTPCCFCEAICETYGNNPQPLSMKPNDRCCNNCNAYKIIPARMAEWKRQMGTTKDDRPFKEFK